jgi:hypothetical protein
MNINKNFAIEYKVKPSEWLYFIILFKVVSCQALKQKKNLCTSHLNHPLCICRATLLAQLCNFCVIVNVFLKNAACGGN